MDASVLTGRLLIWMSTKATRDKNLGNQVRRALAYCFWHRTWETKHALCLVEVIPENGDKGVQIRRKNKTVNLLPYDTDELVKGLVHIHWRILGTGFNVCYLNKIDAIYFFCDLFWGGGQSALMVLVGILANFYKYFHVLFQVYRLTLCFAAISWPCSVVIFLKWTKSTLFATSTIGKASLWGR